MERTVQYFIDKDNLETRPVYGLHGPGKCSCGYHQNGDWLIMGGSTRLTSLKGIEHFPDLVGIEIIGCNLKNIEELKSLKNLEYLDLSRNKITSLKGIENCKNLRYLHCPENRLIDLEGIQGLVNLLKIDVMLNKLENINAIANLKHLFWVAVQHNPCSYKYSDIDSRDISGFVEQELKSAGRAIDNFGSKVSTVSIKKGETPTYTRPKTGISVQDLIDTGELTISKKQSLDISNKALTSLYGIENFKNIKVLNIEHNSLNTLECIESLSKLTELYVSNNSLHNLKGLEYLEGLEKLDACTNNIEDITSLGNCIKLDSLFLIGNKITELTSLAQCVNISHLVVMNNELESFDGIQYLTKLERFFFDSNPIAQKNHGIRENNEVTIKELQLKIKVEKHLKDGDDERGFASIVDTGLFDFITDK